MDELHLSTSSIIATTFFVIVLAFLLKRVNKVKKIAPPQAKGAWPIIGHLHLLGGSKLPHKVLGDMANEHGPIFTIKLGVHKVLVVSNGEMAKDCLTTNDKAFASRPKAEAARVMCYNYAMFGFAPYGDYWRKSRKIFMLEVLSPQRVEMLGYVRVSELRASIKDVYETWANNKKGKNSDMVKVEMSQWFGNLVLNIVVRIISGKRLSINGEEGAHFHKVIREFSELLGAFVVSDFIPCLKFLDVGGYNKSMNKTAKDLDNIFQEWLGEHKRKRDSRQQSKRNQVFIDVLINIVQGTSQDDFYGYDHDTVIKSLCQQFLVAGLDTSSVTLTWALSLLLNNPKTLEIAQNELDEHVGRDRLVEESDLKNLVYLNAIIKETMRLYPGGPLAVPHESVDDCIVGGFNIPKGTRLLLNIWKMHHDPDIWTDPYEFRPERFLTSHKDIDVKGNHYELLPFGSGRRMCPAVSFSLQVLGLTLASLIHQFVLKVPTNDPVDMSEIPGITMTKGTPLEVLLAPRLSCSLYQLGP